MVKRNVFFEGVRDGIPIALGYYAVAFSLGIIAKKVGLTASEGFIGSLFTRASAGEYGAYSVIAQETINGLQATAHIISTLIIMCLITNLRYLLMGASLSQRIDENMPMIKRILIGICITDEIFGISIARKGQLTPAYPLGATAIAGLFWAAGTASGIIAGGALPANIVSALSVALYGMFIAIIIPPSKNDKTVLGAVAASFLLSWICSVAPFISEYMSSGTRTIVLTILISSVVAIIKPVKPQC